MGQKTHPIGLRLGIIKSWNSRWYAPDRNFSDLVYEDMMIKRYINRRLDNAGIANVVISRAPKRVTVDIHTSRPGIVIGRKGAEVDKLREELQLLTQNKDIMLNIVEVRKPELNAKLVADAIARQLEGRVSFRRAMKKSLAATMKMGAVGAKIQCAGRLGGAEIARTEKYKEGRTPLHTLRADIDYATSTANTTYGCIGVKVWVCRGEILDTGVYYEEDAVREEPAQAPAPSRGRHRGPGGADRGGKRPRGRVRRKQGEGPIDVRGESPRGRRPERPRGESQAGGGQSSDRGSRVPRREPRREQGTKPEAPKPKSDGESSSKTE